MSHFSVLVIGDDVEGQLAPYQENNMDSCPKEYLEFEDDEDDFLKDYEEGTSMRIVDEGGNIFPSYDDKFVNPEYNPYEFKSEPQYIIPDGYVEKEIPNKELYATFEEFVSRYYAQERDPRTGRYGRWENPNSKWDWYVLGGRWTGMLKLKPGANGKSGRPGVFGNSAPAGYVDSARICDIDFEGMKEDNKKAREIEWKEYQKVRRFGDVGEVRMKEYEPGIKPECTKGQFTNRYKFSTFAVVKDGKWYECGDMGWWGFVSDEKDSEEWESEFNKLLEGLPPETVISVVDCHI